MVQAEIQDLMRQLNTIFDIVRLVDVTLSSQYSIDRQGDLIQQPSRHCIVRDKDRSYENGVSVKRLAMKGKLAKFQFVGSEVYYMIAKYLEIDSQPYVLEMLSKVTDKSLFGAHRNDKYMESVASYHKKLYIDPLTGAYNRRYYEERLRGLKRVQALAVMDVDNFKTINDTYGHQMGDLALKTIVNVVLSCVRDTDAVVRYGGDEFLLVFYNIFPEAFASRLELIRERVHGTVLKKCQELPLSVSIGGVYSQGKWKDLFQEADEMLYKAKVQKNTVQWR